MSKNSSITLFVLLLCCGNLSQGKSQPVGAVCNITCNVANIIEWADTSFPDIELPEIDKINNWVSGSSTLLLYTNTDVKITADNSDAALLSTDIDSLITEYKLECDRQWTTTAWSEHDNFIKKGLKLQHIKTQKAKHASRNGPIAVNLSVRACSNKTTQQPGLYSATQTITVYWTS